MKCALELLAISAEKKKENEALEAEKKALELTRMKEEAKANTIKYCQTLESILEKEAAKGEDLIAILHVSPDFWYLGLAYVLVEKHGEYADGRRSFEHGVKIDLDYLEQWFKKYCFKVEIKDFYYWWYGFGKHYGRTIEIKPDPDCL